MTSGKIRVLYADDEPAARLLMQSALELSGVELCLASDGADALRQFTDRGCDIVLLDVDMPGLNGYQVCSALRAAVGSELPVVMVTGMDDIHSIEQAYDCGATDFISKPINWGLIGHRLRYLYRGVQVLQDLHAANARNAAILNALPDTLLRVSPEGLVLDVLRSPDPAAICHVPAPGCRLADAYPPATLACLMAGIARAIEVDAVQVVDLELDCGPAGVRHYEVRLAAIASGEVLCLVRDVTERKAADEALRQSETKLHQAQSVAKLGSWHLDIDTNVLEWSPEAYRMFGIAPGTPLTYEDFLGLVHPPDLAAVDRAWKAALDGHGYHVEHRICVGGEIRWVVEDAELERDEGGRIKGGIGTVQDITARKEAETRIHRLAYFDTLTGLANRQSFSEHLTQEIERAERQGTKLAVLFLDLDGFKTINDTLGHGSGDLLLQWAADRLRQGVRPGDLVARAAAVEMELGLARLGGDEFTTLLPNLRQAEDALLVGHRIRDLMRRPYHLSGRNVTVTASIGIAVYPDDGLSASALLKHADTAMYHAKDMGRDNCQFYSESLTDRAMRRLNIEASLRLALERGEFALVYQPQLDLESGRIESVEALVRWEHPEQGCILPEEFIPAAEENGLIGRIGEWVLRTACSDAVRWKAAGHCPRVAVNLSPIQFRDQGLVDQITAVLRETGLPPDWLELELTEGTLTDDAESALATLGALRRAGIRLALDDFGTGWSSLSYLKRLPLTTLKVDRSFVSGVPHDRESMAIIRSIVSLAKNLGFCVTAEGIETAGQMQAMREMSCNLAQGFYLARPVSIRELLALLDR
jgi:diguanylate cyclase (GGDEF)-like protein/PAS domain S-box-containing protein